MLQNGYRPLTLQQNPWILDHLTNESDTEQYMLVKVQNITTSLYNDHIVTSF